MSDIVESATSCIDGASTVCPADSVLLSDGFVAVDDSSLFNGTGPAAVDADGDALDPEASAGLAADVDGTHSNGSGVGVGL